MVGISLGFLTTIAGVATALKTHAGNDFRREPSFSDDDNENGRNCGVEIVSIASTATINQPRKSYVATVAGGGIDAFALDVETALAGDCLPVSEIMDLYARVRSMAHIRGQVVSTKVMVAALRARGWVRVQMDWRDQGKGRPVCYVVPEGEAAMSSNEAA